MSKLDTEWRPGRWWRVLLRDGTVWCETSDEAEAREAGEDLEALGGSLVREYVRTEREWRDES